HTTIYIENLEGVKHEALRRGITLRKLVNRAINKYLKEVPCPALPKKEESPEKEALPPYQVPEQEAAHQDQEVPEKKPCAKAE
ncbi:unnamed protein product, partial [marine sediment metagenome]